jgi:hypothetical protein
MTYSYKVLVEKREGRNTLRGLDVDEMVIFYWMLKEI